MRKSLVTINILNGNEAHFLPRCVNACLAQRYAPIEVVVIDNKSTDGSRELLAREFPGVRVLASERNRYFCGGHNWGIAQTDGEFVLPLNTDCFIEPDFVEALVQRAREFPRAGAVQGKIYQDRPGNPHWRVFDTVGVKMTRSRRNYDRGQGQLDTGQYDHLTEIFGADGVAPLYRREALEDICIFGEYYDEDFLMYREVVDLSWRLWRRGWSSVFTPHAVARHVRNFSPKTRQRQSEFVRQLSYRNRVLTLLKNDTWETFKRDALRILGFDLAMLAYLFARERHLAKSFPMIGEAYFRALAKREIIQQNALMDNLSITQMFDPY